MKHTLSIRPNGVITTTDLAGILLLHGDQVWKVAAHLHLSPSCWGEVVGEKNYGREGYEYIDARRIVEFCLANGIDRINADFDKAFSVLTHEDGSPEETSGMSAGQYRRARYQHEGHTEL